MSHALTSNLNLDRCAILKDRARCLATVRNYFHHCHVIEVDCPLSSASAAIDAHIDLVTTHDGRFLHSSPEYGMKRLLSEGIGDIYQLSHVFRDGELGQRHNPEFMMIEWYRHGFSLDQMIRETAEVIALIIGPQPLSTISYRQALQQHAGFDYVHATIENLMRQLHDHRIPYYEGIEKEGRDAILNLIMAQLVEPKLGQEGVAALVHYPASQAALAKTIQIGEERAAERFEIYFKGIELANGYHELCQAHEQQSRFEASNKQRRLLGKQELPIDFHFLEALNKGLPDCCGVAVGFDRLMMIRHNSAQIGEIIPFAWNVA